MVRSVTTFAGHCLVAVTLVESWLPWWNPSSGNDAEATKIAHAGLVSGDPPHGPTSTETIHRCGGVSGISGSCYSDGLHSGDSWLARDRRRMGPLLRVANIGLWPYGPPLRCWRFFSSPLLFGPSGLVSVGFAAEEHAAIDANESHLRFWVQQCNASQSHRLLLPTRLFSWSDLGAPPQWTLSTSSGKFEAVELVGDLTIWSFVSLLELQGFSLTGANGHALIGTACGSPGRVLGVTARSLRENLEKAEAIHLCRSEECPRGRL